MLYTFKEMWAHSSYSNVESPFLPICPFSFDPLFLCMLGLTLPWISALSLLNCSLGITIGITRYRYIIYIVAGQV